MQGQAGLYNAGSDIMPAAIIPPLPVTPEPKWAGQRTARKAVDILLAHDSRYHRPSPAEARALLIGFALRGKALSGAAYDVIRLERPVDLTNADAIAEAIDAITLCEVKSTNQERIGTDLKGYFFNITGAEMLTAQALGERYRFVFVNTVSCEHQEMAFTEIFSRAKGIYPAWHIRF